MVYRFRSWERPKASLLLCLIKKKKNSFLDGVNVLQGLSLTALWCAINVDEKIRNGDGKCNLLLKKMGMKQKRKTGYYNFIFYCYFISGIYFFKMEKV